MQDSPLCACFGYLDGMFHRNLCKESLLVVGVVAADDVAAEVVAVDDVAAEVVEVGKCAFHVEIDVGQM